MYAIGNPNSVSPDTTASGVTQVSGVKDADHSARDPAFGEVLQKIQSQYGARAEKPREVKKTLGKDDFLRIMITQMKNQDPTNPFKAEQMATEIAQFTSVEQLQNVNQNLSKMANQNKPLEQLAMTNLIGKFVTIDRERFPHQEGQSDTLNFQLSKDAKTLNLAIADEMGEVVYEKELDSHGSGEVSFSWDGIKSNSLPAKSGTYRYRINAMDDKGQRIPINPKIRSKVIGVSFSGGEPIFLVGDAKHQDRVTLQNIALIEMDTSAENASGGTSASKGETQNQAPAVEYRGITDKKQESSSVQQSARGSYPSALEGSNSNQLESLRQLSGQQVVGAGSQGKNAVNPTPEKSFELSGFGLEGGFPNGLSDPDAPSVLSEVKVSPASPQESSSLGRATVNPSGDLGKESENNDE